MSEATAGGAATSGPRSSLHRVSDALAALGNPVSTSPGGRHLMACCPVHEDRTPSLSVTWRVGPRGGMALLHCHGCNARAVDLVAVLGLSMADLFDEPLPPRELSGGRLRTGRSSQQRRTGARWGRLGRLPRPIPVPAPLGPGTKPGPEPAGLEPAGAEHAWGLVATYPYVGAGGDLVQEVLREACSSCEVAHKRFRQRFVVDGGRRVTHKPAGFTPVLYRLPRVLAAVAAGEPVWLLEGEKDVHTGESLGLVATTNTQGGRGFPSALAEVFRGAQVRVVLDRDDTGWDRGVAVHAALSAVGAQVRLLLPATTEAKSDFTDHVEREGFRAGEDLLGLLPVHVEEVAAWAGAGAARTRHAGVEQALAQTQAQLAAAADARAARHSTTAAEHTRFAHRWAAEAEIRWEALRDVVDDVRRHMVLTGTDWAQAAMDVAEDLLRQATTAARTAHAEAGLPVPPGLQPAATPSAAPAAKALATGAGKDYRDVSDVAAGRVPGGVGLGQDGGEAWDGRPHGEVRYGALIAQPVFRIVNTQIVQVERGARAAKGHRADPLPDSGVDPEDETLKLVLGLDVRIVEMEYLEDTETADVERPRLHGRTARAGHAAAPPAPEQLSAVVLAYTHPATGETMQMRVAAEDYRDCAWLESLPGPPDYDPKPAGLAMVRRAVKAVSTHIAKTVRYRSTGWRREPGGQWFFVHAGGAITPAGSRPAPVLLSGPLARYDLPDPTTDPAQLRQAFWEHSAGMLSRMPARVAAPLLGHIYRSALGPNPWVLALIGSPGSYKTSIASLGMHHWGELWDRRKPASSMSGNGDTLNALRIKLNAAKDALYWADDVAPTRDWAAAQKTLEEFARLVHNGEQRSRSTRDGLGVLDGTPPRSSALVTSEVMPRPGSGAQRMLVVPVQAEEVALEDLIALDAEDSRHGRALVMSSLLQWLAGDLETVRARYLAEAGRYAETLRAGGQGVRQAEAVGHTWAGWVCVGDFLVAAGAITAAEREQLLARVDTGLQESVLAAADPDLPTRTGARVRELLAHALRSGGAYVEDVRTGEAPAWPVAGRLGWRRTPMGLDEVGQPRYRTEARGIRFGYALLDPSATEGVRQLLVDSTALEQVLKATAMTMADAPQIDRGTALRALHDEGVLIPELRTGRTPRYTVQRTLHCEAGRRARMTALRLTELLGDGPDEPDLVLDVCDGPRDGPRDGGAAGRGSGAGICGVDTGAGAAGPGAASHTVVHTVAETVVGTVVETVLRTESDDLPDSSFDASQHLGLRSPPPHPGLTSPAFEEQPMSRFADADGVHADSEFSHSAPCLLCPLPTVVRFVGLPLHIPCWTASTAASRASAAGHPQASATSPTAFSTIAAPPLPAPLPAPPAEVPAAAAPRAPAPTATPPAPAAAATPPIAPLSGQDAATRRGAPAQPGRPRPAGAYRAAAAVADTDGVWLPDGTCTPLPQPLTHVGHLADLVHDLQLGTQVTDRWSEPGQVWVTAAMLTALGVDAEAIPADPTKRVEATRALTRGAPLVTGATAEGWQLGGAGDALGAWTRVWRGERRGVWVALIPAMSSDRLEVPVLADAPAPAVLARRLGLFAGALRAPWAMSAASTGLDLMVTLRAKDRERLFTPHEPVPPARVSTLEQDLNWSRVPTEQEARRRFVHAYDRGGSYAAGIAGLELGIGQAEHHPQGRPFDPKTPGYWKFEVPDAGDWRMPHPLNPRGALPARAEWATTPALQLATELGYDVPVLEAYTWSEHGRVLEPWYERIRDARTGLDLPDPDAQAARDQLKVVYTRTIGMLGSEEWMRTRPGYAPDRRHHIVAKARANILRRIAQIGRDSDQWPVAVTADTLVYACDDPDPVSAWPGRLEHLGRGFGQFKAEASGHLVDQVAHLNGRDYRGKELLDHAWDPAAHPTGAIDSTSVGAIARAGAGAHGQAAGGGTPGAGPGEGGR